MPERNGNAQRGGQRASGKTAASSGAFSDKRHSAPEAGLGAIIEWPAHTSEKRPWIPSGRGPKPDRMFTEVQVSIPPFIANLGGRT